MATEETIFDQQNTRGVDPRPIVNCDQEVWVKDRIKTAIKMAEKVLGATYVRADKEAALHALEGIVEGTAIEIIRTLCMEPCFVNLRKL